MCPVESYPFERPTRAALSKINFITCLWTCAFWILANTFPVYDYTWTGVIFEMLWLPMIGALFVLPVLALVMWGKEKYTLKSLNLCSFAVMILLASLMLFIE